MVFAVVITKKTERSYLDLLPPFQKPKPGYYFIFNKPIINYPGYDLKTL